MKKYFAKLNLKISKSNPLWSEYMNYACDHVEVSKFYPDTKGKKFLKDSFKQAWLPMQWFESEVELYSIMQQYDLKPKLFLVEAGHCYNWHKDGFRSVSLNIDLGNEPDYLVLFSENESLYTPIQRLVYEPGAPYILNTQKFHVSINYGNTDRYILTLSKYENVSLSGSPQGPYLEMLKDLEDQGLVDV